MFLWIKALKRAWCVLSLKALLDGAKDKSGGDGSDVDMEITWEPGNTCFCAEKHLLTSCSLLKD